MKQILPMIVLITEQEFHNINNKMTILCNSIKPAIYNLIDIIDKISCCHEAFHKLMEESS